MLHLASIGLAFSAVLFSAQVASICHCLNWVTLCSARGFSIPSPCVGVMGGSLLISKSFSANPVVPFLVLLCTSMARGSIVDQSSSLVVTRQRYCSTH